jgi:hypothetical protein
MTLDGVEQLRVLHGFRPAQYSSAITGVVGAIKCNHNLFFMYTLNVRALTSCGYRGASLKRADGLRSPVLPVGGSASEPVDWGKKPSYVTTDSSQLGGFLANKLVLPAQSALKKVFTSSETLSDGV